MTATIPTTPICLPPAPLNGGPLDTAPEKVGEWIWQPKIDDRRVIIHAPSRTVWNQYGELSVAMDQLEKFDTALTLIQQRANLVGCEWLDAGLMEYRHDLMRGCIVVFDLVQATDYWCRRDQLIAMFPILPDDMAEALAVHAGQIRDRVFVINHFGDLLPRAFEAVGKRLYTMLQDQNKRIGRKFFEGLVAKRVAAAYPFTQKPKTKTPDWVKHRFDQ
jgi:hypothetical protein